MVLSVVISVMIVVTNHMSSGIKNGENATGSRLLKIRVPYILHTNVFRSLFLTGGQSISLKGF